ncbi:hypothetical protein [Paenibacillus periandrae]|uniref:hypothetical protein n=1 Tax=Paenibacillus periandrae TaxID=1761741 RepID=UPI001F09B271|nr:hypothetical protein [Paenibacillus periandrae]
MMKAILLWLGEIHAIPYLIVICKEDQHAEHAVVRVGDYFLDGSGLSTKHALYQRWRYVERLPHVFIRSFNPSEEPDHRNGEPPYYIEEALIQNLATLLAERFNRMRLLQILDKEPYDMKKTSNILTKHENNTKYEV